jgi:hypothetical protein
MLRPVLLFLAYSIPTVPLRSLCVIMPLCQLYIYGTVIILFLEPRDHCTMYSMAVMYIAF